MNAHVHTHLPAYVPYFDDRKLSITPLSHIDIVIIKGCLTAFQASATFDEIEHFIDKHFASSHELKLYFRIDYMDSSTKAHLYGIFQKLNEYKTRNKKATIFWQCSRTNVDILSACIDFREFSLFRFHIELV